MAKAGKVHHWKHGWIPLDGYARDIVARRGKKRDVVGRAAVLDRPATVSRAPSPEEISSVPPGLADFPRIRRDHSFRDDVISTNPQFTQGPEYQQNCLYAVNALELRRRGYDVVASPLPKEYWAISGRKTQDALNMWRTPRGSVNPHRVPTEASQVGAANLVRSWPEGGRGWVIMNWKNGASHIMSVEKINGEPVWSDPQSGTLDASGAFQRAGKIVHVVRVDDLEPTSDVAQFAKAPDSGERMMNRRNVSSHDYFSHYQDYGRRSA